VVTYIVEETVGPLVDELREDLIEQGFEPGTQEYLGPFLRRVTDLRILDPAMGSGHFLTKATGYLSERVMSEVREAEADMPAAFDEQYVRREITKECIYGVDLNGMAVELAKLSMWLETLSADRPLAFLDHHFKQGNSLVGSDIEAIEELESDASADDDSQSSLAEFGATREGTIERLMDIYSEFLAIENEEIEDVREMKRKYAEIEQDDLRQRLVAMANVHTAERFDLDVPGGAYERMAKALEDDTEWVNVAETDWFKSAQALASEKRFFHWKLEFPEAFYTESGEDLPGPGFDAVIGNPPYGVEFDPSDQLYLKKSYETTGSEYDSYTMFIEAAIELARHQGNLGYIVPTVWTKLPNNEPLRRIILNQTALYELQDTGRIFESAIVETLIFCASVGGTAERTEISIVDSSGSIEDRLRRLQNGALTRYTVDQQSFLNNEGAVIDYGTNPEIKALIERVEAESVKMNKITDISQGITPYDRYAGQDDEIIENRAYHSDKKENETYGPWLQGQDVGRYRLNWSGEWLSYGEWLAAPREPKYFTNPRLLFREVTGGIDRVIATYTEKEYYYGHSVIPVITEESEYTGRTLLGLVNSTLLSWYNLETSPNAQKDTFPKMNPDDVGNLPVAAGISNESQRELSDHVDEILAHREARDEINLSLLDYIRPYSGESSLPEVVTYQPPQGVGDTKLTATKDDYENLRIGTVSTQRESDDTILIHATARYKPDDEDAYETDRWGYTETDPIPAIRLTGLTDTEAALVEAFVPVAVDEAGGFANFRETATKTNSLVDRLEALTLPDPDDVADGLERYVEAKERAEELDRKIERTDALIDEIVYELYGLTDEEVEIVEAAVADG
jgi:hypothetical protein